MTPLPKRKLSTARQGHRRQSIAVKLATLLKCRQCGSLYRPHTVCGQCGYYNGKSVKAVKTKQARP